MATTTTMAQEQTTMAQQQHNSNKSISNKKNNSNNNKNAHKNDNKNSTNDEILPPGTVGHAIHGYLVPALAYAYIPGTWYLRGKKSHTASAAAVGHVPGTSTRYQASYAAP